MSTDTFLDKNQMITYYQLVEITSITMLTLQPTHDNRLQPAHHKYSNLILLKKKAEHHRQLFPKTEAHTNVRMYRFKTEGDQASVQHKRRSLQKNLRNCALLPYLERNKSNSNISLDYLSKKEERSNEGTIEEEKKSEQGIKVISDFHPKINKIKLKFIRRENQSCQTTKDQHNRKRRRVYQQAIENQFKNMKINLSCQSISPLASQQVPSNKPEALKTNSKTGHLRSRYQQIPPEEFIYQHQSSILTKGLVDKISKIMRKTHKKFNHLL